MTAIVVAVLTTLLVVSLLLNWYQRIERRRFEATALIRETRALDAAHAAELRSKEQIDAMLDRINTSPRIEVRPPAIPEIDPNERTYIPDYDVEAWNDHVGEPQAAEPENPDLEAVRERMYAQGDAR